MYKFAHNCSWEIWSLTEHTRIEPRCLHKASGLVFRDGILANCIGVGVIDVTEVSVSHPEAAWGLVCVLMDAGNGNSTRVWVQSMRLAE